MAFITGLLPRVAVIPVLGDREGLLDGVAGGLVLHVALEPLFAGSIGVGVPAAGGGDRQGVLLLVEAATGDVDADVAGGIVAGAIHHCGTAAAHVVSAGIAPLINGGVGLGAAEDELLVGGGHRHVVGLLVHVAGGHVGADVAAAAQGVFDGGAVLGALVGDRGIADVLVAPGVGGGITGAAVEQGVAIVMVAAVVLVGLGRHRHGGCHGEYQRLESHRCFHGVSPCYFLCNTCWYCVDQSVILMLTELAIRLPTPALWFS
ncbi:hypothetical protein D3C80_802040 [compost metagenome]